MSVHVGPGILGLPMLCQHAWGHLEEVADQAEHGVLGQVPESKTTLTRVARVCLPQHSMPIARDNLTKK